jgi:hypothetical protein
MADGCWPMVEAVVKNRADSCPREPIAFVMPVQGGPQGAGRR